MQTDPQNRTLMALAKQFRDAAAGAGRDDVVAKVDEAILLLARPGEAGDKPAGRNETAEVVQRILNGLGF